MKGSKDDVNRRRAESVRRWWAGLSTEEKALIAFRRSIAAKRRWARHTKAERKAFGQKIRQAIQEKQRHAEN